jgi:hypothetical protein
MVFFVNAGNTTKAEFPDGMPAHAMLGGPYMMVPVLNTVDLDFVVAHELGHIYWAADEYNYPEISGYLNVPDIFNSSSIMCSWGSWNISGKPDGFNGTWGQLGWRDVNANSIEDIVDTPLLIVLDSSAFDSTNSTLSYNGTAAVTPYTNKNQRSTHRDNVTINYVTEVMYKVDKGQWNECNITPTTVKKEIGNTGDFYFKNTTAIVNFSFITPKLSPGTHVIQIKASDQWGVTSYANDTVTIEGEVHDIAIETISLDKNVLVRGRSTAINVSIANLGTFTETFNVTICANATSITVVPKTVYSFLDATLIYMWNTTDLAYGNYIISAYATQIPNEIDTTNNNCTGGCVTVTIQGDINGDFKVSLADLSFLAQAYGSKPGDQRWNPNADIDNNGVVNIADLVYLAWGYGKKV